MVDGNPTTYDVKPNKAGEFSLTLKIAVIELVRGKEHLREVVLEEQIVVATEPVKVQDEAAVPTMASSGISFN